MIQKSLAKTSLLAALVLPVCSFVYGTECGAQDASLAPPAIQGSVSNPELETADARVEKSKEKLDQARKLLSAAKASLKAAEAEFKACRADRDALALRATAQQLADTSGFSVTTPSEPVRQIIIPPTGARLTPIPIASRPIPLQPSSAQDKVVQSSPNANNPIPLQAPTSDAAVQAAAYGNQQVPMHAGPALDFNAQQDHDFSGAPTPSGDLAPNTNQAPAEPPSVP